MYAQCQRLGTIKALQNSKNSNIEFRSALNKQVPGAYPGKDAKIQQKSQQKDPLFVLSPLPNLQM